MNQTNNKRSGIFLLELMVAILFFALSSAVVLRCFSMSHTLSVQTARQEQAMTQMENMAELLYSVDTNNLKNPEAIFKTIKTEYSACSIFNENINIFFDESWDNCSSNNASYEIILRASRSKDEMCNFKLQAVTTGKTQTEIANLTFKRYAKDKAL